MLLTEKRQHNMKKDAFCKDTGGNSLGEAKWYDAIEGLDTQTRNKFTLNLPLQVFLSMQVLLEPHWKTMM